MQGLVFVSFKGGTGKSTVAANLGAALARRGGSVLLVDVDPQGSLTAWTVPGDAGRPSLLEVLRDGARLEDVAVSWKGEGVEVVPSAFRLAGLDRDPAFRLSALADAVKAARKRWRWILLDTPPNPGGLTVAALLAARIVVVPLRLEPLGVAGLRHLLQTAADVREEFATRMLPPRLLPVAVDRRSRVPDEMRTFLEGSDLAGSMLSARIRQDSILARAPARGRSIFHMPGRPRSAEDFEALAEEVADM